MKNHTQTANPNVSEMLLEGVKVYGVKPRKFTEQQNTKSQVKSLNLWGTTFSPIGILNSLWRLATSKCVNLLNRLNPKSISELT